MGMKASYSSHSYFVLNSGFRLIAGRGERFALTHIRLLFIYDCRIAFFVSQPHRNYAPSIESKEPRD